MTAEPTLAQSLAEYVAQAAGRIPEEVLARANDLLVDVVACAIGATVTTPGRRMAAHASTRAAAGPASAFGLARRIRAEDAAHLNGTLAHLLELDDGHRPSGNHLGCVVVPAALAMAEETGASSRRLLEAVVLGYDVMGRVGESVCLPRRGSPFQGTGTTGVFGAAAAAGHLLGLEADQLAHALGIAGTGAAGLREATATGPDCKPLQAGRAARVGIEAALLAGVGYEGPTTIFEGPNGFCAAMSSEPRFGLILDGLGERYAVLESGVKSYATCGMLFTVLDAVVDLRSRLGPAELAAAEIRVSIPSVLLEDRAFSRRRPATRGEAHHSVPFSVAAAVVDGTVTPAQMTDAKLSDDAIRSVEERVLLTSDPEVDALYSATRDDPFFFYPGAVDVVAAGATHRLLYATPRGYDPAQPATTADIARKFVALTDGLLADPGGVAERLLALQQGLDVRAAVDTAGICRTGEAADPEPAAVDIQ